MKIKKLLFVLLLCTVSLAALADSDDDNQTPIQADSIIPYLEKIIAWGHNVAALDVTPGNAREILLYESLHKNSAKVLTSAFDLARAEAGMFETKSPAAPPPAASSSNLKTLAATAGQDYNDKQSELAAATAQAANARAKDKPLLLAKQDKLASELKLLKERQDLLQSVLKLSGKAVVDDTSLTGKINNLAKTVPELRSDEQKPAADTTNIVTPQAVSSKGIIGLSSDLYGLYSKKKDVAGLAQFTAKLQDDNKNVMDFLKTSLKAKVKQGNDIAGENGADAAGYATQKQQLDSLAADFRKLSTIVIPLSQNNNSLNAAKDNLDEWNDNLQQQLQGVFHRLAMRLIVLLVAIFIPVALSIAAKRAIKRYAQDPRRAKFLNTARRVVFIIFLTFIVILNLISEVGSLVTFAGFLTAGLAVALQTVILSLVAHFFFIGRYGVRVGDRVMVSGVTGEVIKIGMVRFYLMELAGTDFDLNPTGKIVGYPNSVLFQPAAFVKLIPGTNYTWNEVKLILDPSTDFSIANKTLMAAVDKVYADYRKIMRQQQDALQRATHSNAKIPEPAAHLRFTDAGLAFVVRYPIEINKAAEIKDRLTRELLDAIKAEPRIKVAA